jgi:hypothetical protein
MHVLPKYVTFFSSWYSFLSEAESAARKVLVHCTDPLKMWMTYEYKQKTNSVA